MSLLFILICVYVFYIQEFADMQGGQLEHQVRRAKISADSGVSVEDMTDFLRLKGAFALLGGL